MIVVVPELCTKCGFCVKTCPSKIFTLDQDTVGVEFEDYCIFCGHCLAICPENAIRHEELDYTQFQEIPKGKIDPQHISALFQTRRSIRNFKNKPVEKELIQRLINEIRYSPTSSNSQNVYYLILQNKSIPPFVAEVRNFYSDILKIFQSSQSESTTIARRVRKWNYWLKGAEKGKDAIFYDPPVIIVAYTPSSDPMASLNVGFAISYLMLAAHANGLGTVNIGYAVEAIRRKPKIAENLGISTEEYGVYAVLSMGYPAYKYSRIPLRKPAHIIWHEIYENTDKQQINI
jgi:nitroreductase/NAD-dependent dihydropyrimidine dehydrogenase PreA subunit